MSKRQDRLETVLWSGWGLLVVIYALIPVLWILSLSLKQPADLNDQRFFPARISFDNYRAVFEDAQFPAALWNSFGIALLATGLSIVLAMFAAYAIVRLRFAGKKLVLAGVLAISMFPPVSIIGPLFNLWRIIGLYDTWAGLIIPYMTFTLPLSIWTLSAFFPRDSLGSGQGRARRWRDAVSGLLACHCPVGGAGRVYGGDPGFHLRLERFPVRDLTDLHK